MNIINYILKFLLLVLMFYLLPITKSQAQTALSQDPIYSLVFEDDFDSTAIDTNNWYSQYYGFQCNQRDSNNWHNNGYGVDNIDQAYNSPNFSNIYNNFYYDTSGTGYVRLISRYHSPAIYEPIYDFNYTPPLTPLVPFKFTTGMLYGRKNFKYGYFEMSFRTSTFQIDSHNAYSPNFWLWRSDTSAPVNTAYSEIDIYEMEGRNWTTAPCSHYRHFPNVDEDGNFLSPPAGYGEEDTVYWHGNTFETPSDYIPYERNHTPVNTPFTPGNWHTIGCEWTPDYIDIYYYSLGTDTFQRFSASKYPVNQLCAMPMIIDNYTPAPRDTFFIPYDSVNTQMPFNYDINYIRVYQVKQHCISKTFLNTSSATYADTLWQDLTIGGSGGSAVFNSGYHHLAATDFILLQEGFEVSGTGSVLINTMSCQSEQSMSIGTTPSNPPIPLTRQQKNDIINKQNDK